MKTPTYHSDLNLRVVKEHSAMFSTFQEALLRTEILYTPIDIKSDYSYYLILSKNRKEKAPKLCKQNHPGDYISDIK